MMDTDGHGRELGAFLRAHRERLRIDDGGLPAKRLQRRRTPGLRREEVADLCGMSPTWYSWIEQGREVSVSPAALGRVADALRLSAAERAYLFALARKQDPAPKAAADGPDARLPAALEAALAATGSPAYVLDRLWCARGWNAPGARLFESWLGRPDPSSLLDYVFLDPSARSFIVDWPERARRVVAEFRSDTGRNPTDAAFRAMVTRLREASSAFAALWDERDVLSREGGLREFRHPVDGLLRYEQLTLVPAGQSDLKLVMLLPKDDCAPT